MSNLEQIEEKSFSASFRELRLSLDRPSQSRHVHSIPSHMESVTIYPHALTTLYWH